MVINEVDLVKELIESFISFVFNCSDEEDYEGYVNDEGVDVG